MNPILKRIITALTVAAVVVCGVVFLPKVVIAVVLCALIALAVVEYSMLLAKKLKPASAGFIAALAVGAALIVGGLAALPYILFKSENGSIALLAVVAMVKLSDMGGFAFGMLSSRFMKRGNHKLCPTISPNKSWEGLFGSIVGSFLASYGFLSGPDFGWGSALLLGLAAALVGTFGDLVESKFKRWVGVKDSSTISWFNGMGGVLDMLDSLLFAPAVVYFLMQAFKV